MYVVLKQVIDSYNNKVVLNEYVSSYNIGCAQTSYVSCAYVRSYVSCAGTSYVSFLNRLHLHH